MANNIRVWRDIEGRFHLEIGGAEVTVKVGRLTDSEASELEHALRTELQDAHTQIASPNQPCLTCWGSGRVGDAECRACGGCGYRGGVKVSP